MRGRNRYGHQLPPAKLLPHQQHWSATSTNVSAIGRRKRSMGGGSLFKRGGSLGFWKRRMEEVGCETVKTDNEKWPPWTTFPRASTAMRKSAKCVRRAAGRCGVRFRDAATRERGDRARERDQPHERRSECLPCWLALPVAVRSCLRHTAWHVGHGLSMGVSLHGSCAWTAVGPFFSFCYT